MDYGDVLKRAWNATWRYKILWLFGLFAGTGGYSYNSGSSSRGGGSGQRIASDFGAFERVFYQYLWVLVVVGVILLVVGIVWWVLSIAARGGLIHLVNEAQEGRPVRAGDGWRVGFQKWGRIWLQEFVISLPIVAVALLLGVIVAISVVGMGAGAAAKNPGAVLASLSGFCFLLVLFVIVIVPLAVVLGIIGQLGMRYGVIDDVPAVQALKRGWGDLRAKRGAFVMFLIMWGVGIAYGIAVAAVMLITVVPAVFMILARQYALGAGMIIVGILILIVPNAIFAAFSSAAWTVFFRKMTGRTPIGGVVPAPVPAAPGAFPPPPGPAGPAEPTPPAQDPWKAANEIPGPAPAPVAPPAEVPPPPPPPVEAPPEPGTESPQAPSPDA